MEQSKQEEIKLDVLIKECDAVGQGIRNLFLSGQKIVALGFTIIGGAAAYGTKQGNGVILLLLPIAVFGVCLYGLNQFTELMAMAGYKRHLEERINEVLGEHVLLWESSLSETRHRDPGQPFLWSVYGFFLLLSIGAGLFTAWPRKSPSEAIFWGLQYPSQAIFWVLLVIVVSLSVLLSVAFYKMSKAFYRFHELAKQAWEKAECAHIPNTAMDREPKN